MSKFKISYLSLFILLSTAVFGQQDRWQQRAEYKMDVKMDVETHRFTGTQKLVYYNNSPDTLIQVYYHLFFNAFQPNSMMDTRSRTISDPDSRVKDRIYKLSKDEIGYQKVTSLTQNGKATQFQVEGTILEVRLAKPIMPKSKTTFEMEFNGQVPIQIRRSGRDNKEDISYSMSQWYPKMSEYDFQGWHANPYIGREFHGVWGDFDVKITIDSKYVVGGSGYLQNADKIGHGYQKEGIKVSHKTPELTWHFKAPNVHDFMWAADPDYIHKKVQVPNGPEVHFFYDKNTANIEAWEKVPEFVVKAFQYLNVNFGKYPYKQFSVVQGGDGGMEYAMSTLVTGDRSLNSLLGVTVHEMIHSWYQGVLASNESLFPWMDEGFTTFASAATMHNIKESPADENPHGGSYRGYYYQAKSGQEEPLRTHADHYKTNRSHGINSYSKGSVLVNQLGYVIGEENLMIGMRRYFNTWKFKHPNSNDFMRIMEKVSGIELDWYFEHFVNTTNTIDYGIKSIRKNEEGTIVVLERKNTMMMPIDLEIEYEDGSKEIYYIPLRMMRGLKPAEDMETMRHTQSAWPWTNPTYELQLSKSIKDIKRVESDTTQRLADIDPSNNIMERSNDLKFK
jgi:hypothetical protein